MATMREVARLAGVSQKTVSRVVRGEGYVSAELAGRVQAAVAELQYVPNRLPVSFRTGSHGAVGVAVPDVADPFFAVLVQALEARARERGTAVVVTGLGYDGAEEPGRLEALLHRQLDGLVVVPVARDQGYLRPWQQRTPMVFVDRAPRRLRADVVLQDDRGGGRAATGHLLRAGHRRIAFLGDPLSLRTSADRLAGYRDALSQAGVEADDDLVHAGDVDIASLATVLERMTANRPPTAIFSANARCTVQLVPVLRSMPDPPQLVGFGDFPLAAELPRPVTVVDQDPAAVGRLAAQRLFDRIDDPGAPRRRTVLPVRLVVR